MEINGKIFLTRQEIAKAYGAQVSIMVYNKSKRYLSRVTHLNSSKHRVYLEDFVKVVANGEKWHD